MQEEYSAGAVQCRDSAMHGLCSAGTVHCRHSAVQEQYCVGAVQCRDSAVHALCNAGTVQYTAVDTLQRGRSAVQGQCGAWAGLPVHEPCSAGAVQCRDGAVHGL